MELRVVQTTPKLILEWDPVAGAVAGYRGRAGGVGKWTQTQQTRMTFAANATGIVIQALGVEDEGKYPPSPPPPGDWKGLGYMAWRGVGLSSDASRFDVNMIDTTDARSAKRKLRYVHPFGLGYFLTPVALATARQNGWVLKNASGGEVERDAPYRGQFAADVGLRAYQDAWAQGVLAFCEADGYDGVFVDDCLRDLPGSSVTQPEKYPTLPSREAAMLSFLSRVSELLHGAGLYVSINSGGYISGGTDPEWPTGAADRRWWGLIANAPHHPDALMTEYFQSHPASPTIIRHRGAGWHENWDGWQQHAAWSMALPIDPMFQADMDDPVQASYCLHSFLLEWDGHSGCFVWAVYYKDPWLAIPGKPTGPKRTSGNRVERPYEGGLVWVDPVAGTSGIS